MDPQREHVQRETRRYFFGRAAAGIGTAALASLLPRDTAHASPSIDAGHESIHKPHFQPRAKRVIYLFQSGAPSQLDLFDYKPNLVARNNEDLPDSVRMGQRLTGMTSEQKRFPVAPSTMKFAQHGESGAWLSEILPHTSAI